MLDELATDYKVPCVDDGSSDAAAALLQHFRRHWPELRVVGLRAHSGHQAAISPVLARARGECMVTIDADLQDPPEFIAEMLRVGRDAGLAVIHGVRTDRSTDTAFKRMTAEGFCTIMNLLVAKGVMNAGDFRMMPRTTVDAVLSLPEQNRVLCLVVPTLGFPSAEVGCRSDGRAAGESKYP